MTFNLNISRNIIKQFGLLLLNTVCEIVETPNMLIPSNPAPVELLIFTSEMSTLVVLRKKKVNRDHGLGSLFSTLNSLKIFAPQNVKLSLAILSVVTFMNANPNDPVH